MNALLNLLKGRSLLYALAFSLMLPSIPLAADDQLLFLEGQLVGGYSRLADEAILYSYHPHEAMQKPSVGFDYIRKFNNGYRDTGTLAIQYRVAYNDTLKPRYQSQLFNFYYKHKFPGVDVWLGSNKPATGLSSYNDNHSALLYDMTMKVFTYDRDWGIGAEMDKDWMKVSVSATNGAGMNIYNKEGNYMLAGRVGFGNFNKSNYTVGISGVHGKVLEAMGYQLGHVDSGSGEYILHPENYIGVDGSARYLNYSLKFDALTGNFYNMPARALLVRGGIHLLDEDRLTLEGQYLYSKHAVFEKQDVAGALAFRITPDITLRAIYNYDLEQDDYKIVGQLYYYKGLSF